MTLFRKVRRFANRAFPEGDVPYYVLIFVFVLHDMALLAVIGGALMVITLILNVWLAVLRWNEPDGGGQ